MALAIGETACFTLSKPLAQPPLSIEDTYAEALEEVPADVRARRIPSSWIDGVARLDHHRPHTDIPPHRWRQFTQRTSRCRGSRGAAARGEWGRRPIALN